MRKPTPATITDAVLDRLATTPDQGLWTIAAKRVNFHSQVNVASGASDDPAVDVAFRQAQWNEAAPAGAG